MAQPNGLNPKFEGPVKASNFLTPYGLTLSKVITSLNGTVRLPLFATTVDGSNGFGGTFNGVRTIGKGTTAGTITIRSDEGGTVKSITVPVLSTQGSVNGSACVVAFTLNGCSTIESNTAAILANVEIMFTVAEI